MIRRIRRVTFRLTFQEEDLFAPLIKTLHCWTWSDLVRVALRRLVADQQAKTTSDNDVRHPDLLSDNDRVSDKKKPAANGKVKNGRKTLKK